MESFPPSKASSPNGQSPTKCFDYAQLLKTLCLVPAAQREQVLRDVVEYLRPHLYIGGKWSADYRRLRVVAVKV